MMSLGLQPSNRKDNMEKKKTATKKDKEAVDPKKARLEALAAAMQKIEKDYGKGTIMRLRASTFTGISSPRRMMVPLP